MEQKNVLEVVIAEVSHALKIDAAAITPESKMVEQFGADPVDLMGIAFGIEYALDVEIQTEELYVKILEPSEVTVAEIVEAFQSVMD